MSRLGLGNRHNYIKKRDLPITNKSETKLKFELLLFHRALVNFSIFSEVRTPLAKDNLSHFISNNPVLIK